MPQQDRYRPRTVKLDFTYNERFTELIRPGYFSLVLVTDGAAAGKLNGEGVTLTAPCVLCLSDKDQFTVLPSERLAAQTLHFAVDFFGTADLGEEGIIPNGLSAFQRSDFNTGLFLFDKTVFAKLREWFFIVGTEVLAQSDSLWVCRIKKYLLQIIGMLDDLCGEQEQEPVNLALRYIYSNYFKKITLDEVCRQACSNRVSLNKIFKARYGCTAMEYLTIYRLKMAEKILTYTRMNLSEVAHATGFEYDTYFIRQFTRWKGQSPTQFRKISQRSLLDDTRLSGSIQNSSSNGD
ncbi:MAG: helix-turn-helix transcriptional regulator [Oscillospiraceae bacterium]|nr:helix-turn-helix transcriptional regulator [Oscillospiraceae bacterium]